MVHAFISTNALRTANFGTTIFSVVAHTGLIAFAVRTSGRPPVAAHESPHVQAEHVTFVEPRALVELRVSRAAESRARPEAPDRRPARVDPLIAVTAMTSPLVAPLEIPSALPAVDFSAVATESVSFGDVSQRLARTVIGPANAVPGMGNAYSEIVVEKAVFPRRGNPIPRYPDALERVGIEGRLMVRFVVDSTGRVDPAVMEFPQQAERHFVESIKYALLHSRYFPAELGGQRVRQLVQQEFVFLIRRQ